MFTVSGRRARVSSLGLLSACLLFAVSTQIASAASNELTIRHDKAGVTVKVNLRHKGPVAVSLNGRRVYRRDHTPLSVRIPAGKIRTGKSARLVVRDLRTGRPLVIRYLRRQPTAPRLTLTAQPGSPTTSTTVEVAWTATDATRVSCALDAAAAAACSSPALLRGLAVGDHVFRIVASSTGGKTEVAVRWTVTEPAPTQNPTPTPTPTTTTTTTTTTTPDPLLATPSSVTAPTPPSSYSLPAGAVWVRDTAALVTALSGPTLDIVLADGSYDLATTFTNAGGHRLYAEHVGKAVLRTGMVIGSNFGRSGAVLRGLAFHVSTPSKAFGGGIVHIWGNGGASAQILDCTFSGGWAVPYGLLAFNPSGLRVERSQFYSFTDVALRLSDNTSVAYGAATPVIETVNDILVDGVHRTTPGSSNGTAEAGVWIGHPVRAGVRRIKVANVSWSGIQTVNNSWDTTFEDLDVNMGGASQAAGVGVYMEHYTRNVVFDRLSITGAKVGFNGEWADPAWGGVAGAHNVAIRNGVIDSAGSTIPGRQAGVYLDEGTESTTVTGILFKNQNWSAIGAYKVVGTNSFGTNSYQMAPGAIPLSTEHI